MRPDEPKFSVDALPMVQDAVIVICTVMFNVVVVARASAPRSARIARHAAVFLRHIRRESFFDGSGEKVKRALEPPGPVDWPS
ncbi:hypothetical protein X743_16440 [Mesorhizobium sp. LNHC252B00]|nr:hypothetical protein X743_16440 [Mesorhizobium sp. LNHC252B00]